MVTTAQACFASTLVLVATSMVPSAAGAAEPLAPSPPPTLDTPTPPVPPAPGPSASVPPPPPAAATPTKAPPPSATTRAPARRWYGWQTLTAAAIADTLFVVGAATAAGQAHSDGAGTTALVVSGYLGRFLSGAVIHAAHGNWRAGGASLALNVAAPLVVGIGGALVTAGVCSAGKLSSDCGYPALAGAVFGYYGGAALATTIDAAVLAYEPIDTNKPARSGAATPWFAVVPMLGPGQTGLGVRGQF